MARRRKCEEDRLVEAIRTRRLVLGQNLRALVALQPVRSAIRRRPLAWVTAGGASGFVAARFLLRPTWKHRRSLARRWLRGRLREIFLNLVLLGMREGSRLGAAARPTEPEAGLAPEQRGPGDSSSRPTPGTETTAFEQVS